MSLEWTHPWLGMFALIAAPVWLLARRAPGLVLFSSLRVLPARTSTWRTVLSWIPDALAAAAIVALAIALAGPRRGEKDARIHKEGIAIVMAVDTSSSMAALDLSEKDKELTRLDAIKKVFEAFVKSRPDDAIGMVGFARYADTRSPLTLDHDNLISAARAVELTPPRTADDGTAIGDGLALAVERLAASPAPSKVVILLTDGEDNASQVMPDEAAEMARLAGVKVYTIGAGTNGTAPMRLGDELIQVPVRIDEDLLRSIATATGGSYFRADNASALRTIYGEIDKLERTKFEETRFYEYEELYGRFVALGLVLAIVGLTLRASLFQEVAMSWVHPERVHLLWAALAVVGILAALELRGRGSLAALLSPLMQRRLVVRPSVGFTVARLGLVLCALVAGVIALMRPQSRGETVSVGSHSAADVIVVLDVSKSMLAEDTAPNRLRRAKVEIQNMARQMHGYRLGLVAFAGRAVLLCPLTPDQAFFDLVLSGVDTRSVSRGGTRIGDAVRTAVKGFPEGPGAKLLVLITDGEDHESGPLDAAKEAADQGVRIVAVGLGSDQGDGSEIVITDPQTGAKSPLMHDGVPVKSKLDSETLTQMAAATDGVYVPAGTSALDLRSILKEHIEPMVRAEGDAAVRTVPVERYPWAVMLAIVALLGAAIVGSVRRIS